jgi:hypothetical protein
MEELGDSRDFHFHHDLGLLFDDRWRSTSFNDNRELTSNLPSILSILSPSRHLQCKSNVSKKSSRSVIKFTASMDFPGSEVFRGISW